LYLFHSSLAEIDYQEKIAITTKQESCLFIKPDTIEKAKRILGRHFDVYALESDWLQWWEQSGKPELQSPDGAFFNFCKQAKGKKAPELAEEAIELLLKKYDLKINNI
jgi:hypothetical protein